MYRDEVEPLAVQVARETLEMYHELVRLRAENEELREYRKLYIELLDADIEHSQHMIGDLLKLALTPGVMAACAAANADAPYTGVTTATLKPPRTTEHEEISG